MKKSLYFIIIFLFASSAMALESGTIRTNKDNPVFVPDELIVIYDQSITEGEKAGIRHAYGLTKKKDSFKRGKFTVYKHKNPKAIMNMLKYEPSVLHVEQNAYAYATGTPNDPYYGYQWHMIQINMEAAWDQSTGEGVVVAVIDTGVRQSLEDFQDTTFVAGYDFVNIDNDPTDDEGHGSHVAGTIAQSTNNNLGVAGVAYNARIMPVKVLNRRGSGTYDDIVDGIEWATDHGASVINLSLGGNAGLQILEDAVNYAWEKGVVVVCAAGNDNTDALHYPSAYEKSISVSACTLSETKASYSNYGDTIDITAPGGDAEDIDGDGYYDMVLQNTFVRRTEGYYFYAGTSMASPHVAGVAALIKSKDQNLTNAEIRNILETTADDLGSTNWDGAGLLNAEVALNAVTGGSSGDLTPPDISNVAASNVTTTEATITWITDEAADSVVEYGLDDNYGNTVSDNSLVTSHSINLTGLDPDTTYHYKVISSDISENTAESGGFTFTTPSTPSGDAYLYVSDIAMSLKTAGPNTFANAVVTILDNDGIPVFGATVEGSWSGVVSGTASGYTGTDGTIKFQSAKTKSSGIFIFTMINVTGSSVYDPDFNVEDEDSISN